MVLDPIKFLSTLRTLVSGQAVRNELIRAAADLASAILMLATHASVRLATARGQHDAFAKRQTIQRLAESELAAFSRLNGMCGGIYNAGNALTHGLTAERWNINLGALGDAKATFAALTEAEWGLQKLFAEQLRVTTDGDIDGWIEARQVWLADVCARANAAVTQLSAAI